MPICAVGRGARGEGTGRLGKRVGTSGVPECDCVAGEVLKDVVSVLTLST